MLRSILFWLFALLITLGSAVYQRMTGPTYPIDGALPVGDTSVSYSLTRSHGGDGDQPVLLIDPSGNVTGDIAWKRYNTDDEWTHVRLERMGDTLRAWLPHQPPAGKLEYFVEIDIGDEVLRLPAGESAVTRFKGHVPAGALIPHIIFMFLAIFVSTRAGLEALRKNGNPRPYTIVTITLLAVGGLVFGPIVQKYAFDAYWTGFPFGTDLTDNKTLIMFLAWVFALGAVWKTDATLRHPARRWFVLAAAIVTFAMYLIPHSMMGSELDYNKLDEERARWQAQDTLATPMPDESLDIDTTRIEGVRIEQR
jgi:hypothetical protein